MIVVALVMGTLEDARDPLLFELLVASSLFFFFFLPGYPVCSPFPLYAGRVLIPAVNGNLRSFSLLVHLSGSFIVSS